MIRVIVIIFVFVYFPASSSSSGLSFGFYAVSCPPAESIVRSTVRSASSADPSLPGKLLRLLFHDCFVEGCDASVLLRGNGTERSDPANTSLDGFSVIDAAKMTLEFFCPGTVSCADILALAARDAVEFTGGPVVEVPTGRRDGRVSLAGNVRPNIIDTSFTLDQMLHVFLAKGLSLDDLVTLSGAHTIGASHCSTFSDRFQVGPNGNITFVDASLDREYAMKLTKTCRAAAANAGGGSSSSSSSVNNDPDTPFLFDNNYFKGVLAHKGLLRSDSALLNGEATLDKVKHFADDEDGFFTSWAESFLRLTTIQVKTNNQDGEIRLSCSVVNAS